MRSFLKLSKDLMANYCLICPNHFTLTNRFDTPSRMDASRKRTSSGEYGKRRNRLIRREEWLDVGLDCLQANGIESVKAQTLARDLGVSRGSFYWHFGSLEEFLRALLERWREMQTEAVMAAVRAGEHVGAGRLEHLLATARKMAADRYDPAMRSWAMRDKEVARAVAEIDLKRIDFTASIFREAGFDRKEARIRAQMLYMCRVGETMMAGILSEAEREALKEKRLELLVGRRPTGQGKAADEVLNPKVVDDHDGRDGAQGGT